MKLYLCFITSCVFSLSAWSQASLLYNKGASIYMTPGSYMTVNNGSLANQDGLIENAGQIHVTGSIINDDSLTGGVNTPTGLYDLEGDWVNNGTVISHQDSVQLSGGAQQITGTSVTAFHHLILDGTSNSVKTQTINATVDGVLDLRDDELATQQYEMLVLNTAPAAITKGNGSNGFVSSLDTGKLSRATNSTTAYLYPTGTPSSLSALPFYYRPIDMTPSASAYNIYGARVAHDPTADTYDVDKLDDTLCRVNPLYYHRLYHSQGANSSRIKMYYEPATDGIWTQMAHWGNAGNWNYMGSATAGSGSGFSTLEVRNWSNFTPHPFALGSLKFLLNAGADRDIYSGQQIHLNPIIGLTASAIDDIQWSPSTFLDFDNVKDPTATPTETIQYTIEVTDKSGCKVRDSLKLSLLPDQLLIPTAFSPNKDGLNDIFRPLNKNLTKIAFQIFDRWGEKVFETDEVGEGWDGTYKNVRQGIGVYIWKAEYQLQGASKTLSASGNVTIVK